MLGRLTMPGHIRRAVPLHESQSLSFGLFARQSQDGRFAIDLPLLGIAHGFRQLSLISFHFVLANVQDAFWKHV